MQIDYTAKRSLKAGHVVDTDYTINVELRENNRSYRNIGPRNVALDGTTVTVVNRREEIYNLTTQIITDTSVPDNADLIEFLDSVVSGETFQTDVNGSLVDYVLEQNTYRRRRQGTLDIFTYAFRIRRL